MISVGTDIIDVKRIAAKRDAVFKRVLTPAEQEYCSSHGTSDQVAAGHFAAKEAAFKALRLNKNNKLSWLNIEIAHLSGGAPYIILHGPAKQYAESNQLKRIEISISHVSEFATATAICEWGK